MNLTCFVATGNKCLYHTMGKSDPTKAILTEEEFCSILTKIRTKLHNNDGEER